MHFLPVLFIPAFIWIALNARRWGLFADVPVDSQARVDFWASQALAHLKVELSLAGNVRVENHQLLYVRGKTEARIWSANGRLYKQEGVAARESLSELGREGEVGFAVREGLLVIEIRAQDGPLYRRLEASLPLASGAEGACR